MQAEFTVSIGLCDKDSHVQVTPTDKARAMIFQSFGDCTVQECRGHFTHKDGTVVEEISFRVYVYDDHTAMDDLAEKCRQLKVTLNQECIVLSWRPCGETAFI